VLPSSITAAAAPAAASTLRPPSSTVLLAGTPVNAIAIGTLAWSVAYPDASRRPSEAQIRAMVREVLSWPPQPPGSSGGGAPTLFDVADAYSPAPPGDEGWMESLLARELRALAAGGGEGMASPPLALIATKGGMERTGPTSRDWKPIDSKSNNQTTAAVATAFQDKARKSCRRLGAAPFLWQVHHAQDQNLAPILLSVGSLKASDGPAALHVGLCNVPSLAVLKQCLTQLAGSPSPSASVASVQNKFSYFHGPTERARQEELLDWCEASFGASDCAGAAAGSVVYMAYGLFGGLDSRNNKVSLTPQSQPALCALAARHGVSPHALLVAYVRHRWPRCCMPLVGARDPGHLRELGTAYGVRLSAEEVRAVRGLWHSR